MVILCDKLVIFHLLIIQMQWTKTILKSDACILVNVTNFRVFSQIRRDHVLSGQNKTFVELKSDFNLKQQQQQDYRQDSGPK